MDMSNYVQPNCVNGVSKEEAEMVREIPQIQEDITNLDDRVSTLENESGDMKDWELYDGTDWSQFSTDGKANQELILRLMCMPFWVTSSVTHYLKYTGIEVHLKKGDIFSNTDIEDNDSIYPIFDGSKVSTSYYAALGQAKFKTKGINDNTDILTSTSVKIIVEGAVLFIDSTSASITSTQIQGRVLENNKTLTKNGTGENKILLYYRPTE